MAQDSFWFDFECVQALSLNMAIVVLCASFAALSYALPGDPQILDKIRAFKAGELDASCTAKECQKPERTYERVMGTQPGVQWDDAGGYCGSWSIQRAALAKGAWISQQQVRNHTVAGGGHDEEILATNIDLALKNLKIKAEGFDYQNTTVPQVDSYRKWIKRQLVNGHALAWMIMLSGGHYPVYSGLPYGLYSHVEPVVGILSNHPLTDDDFYDDDVIVHYTDADTNTYYRTMDSLPGDYLFFALCYNADYTGYPCINKDRGFGWAIQGFLDETPSFPVSLALDQWQSEPDIRAGEAPISLAGTLTVEGLTIGERYAIYRWDSVDTAFDYSNPHSVRRFAAEQTEEVYTDPVTFSSGGATYYRCVADASVEVMM
uniref:Peptidase C1A papain C-terminal domain-containing protein n=1 Tax=Noctiluca scintillans TaxID=2966 RepID=A0A7S1A8D9_NOCSC